MHKTIEHESGVIFSVKTFRPLWVFPWLSSVWRALPMSTCIGTIRYEGKLRRRGWSR